MAPPTRLIDTQWDLFDRIIRIETNIKKEPRNRRNQERKAAFLTNLKTHWKIIKQNHETLIKAKAPSEYQMKYQEIVESVRNCIRLIETWESNPEEDNYEELLKDLMAEITTEVPPLILLSPAINKPIPLSESPTNATSETKDTDDALSSKRHNHNVTNDNSTSTYDNSTFATSLQNRQNFNENSSTSGNPTYSSSSQITETSSHQTGNNGNDNNIRNHIPSTSGIRMQDIQEQSRMNATTLESSLDAHPESSMHDYISQEQSRTRVTMLDDSQSRLLEARTRSPMHDYPFRDQSRTNVTMLNDSQSRSQNAYNECTMHDYRRQNINTSDVPPYQRILEQDSQTYSRVTNQDAQNSRVQSNHAFEDNTTRFQTNENSGRNLPHYGQRTYTNNQESQNFSLINQLTEQNEKVSAALMLLANNLGTRRGMKPPQIVVDKFDGNFKNFKSFKEMYFRSLSNAKWNNVELFLYLKTKLEGEALDAISSFQVDDQSHDLAWELLERTFNNKRKRLESAMEKILDPNLRLKYRDLSSLNEFANAFQAARANIEQLKSSVDDVLMEIMLPHMDIKTRDKFEDFLGRSVITPTFNQMIDFLEKEKGIWSYRPGYDTILTKTTLNKAKPVATITKAHVTTETTPKERHCVLCSSSPNKPKNHNILDCETFLGTQDRVALLRQHKMCIFCGQHKFIFKNPCRSKKNLECATCKGKHHTLLHTQQEATSEQTTNTMVTQDLSENKTILPTAIAHIIDNNNKSHAVRCLVDLCAERSYVSEDVVQKLRLQKHKTHVTIAGINGLTGKATSFTKLKISIQDSSIKILETDALVVPRITGTLPSIKLPTSLNKENLQFADPVNNKPSVIGILLGGDIATKLFKQGIPNKITSEGFLLQSTHLGWLVSGTNSNSTKNYVSTFITTNESFENLSKDEELTQRIIDFYELPEYESPSATDEEYCENMFREKHYRMEDGRYVVPTPWKLDGKELGQSYSKALRMFFGQESKWQKDARHYEMSNDFMSTYEKLGHMTRVEKENQHPNDNEIYYIPYMSIIRQGSLTTKLRNVFNASMPTTNGISLNDTMHEGPKLQTLIKDVILTARSFPYIYSADISMMFRQILLLPEDRNRHRIIWRPSKNEPLREYMLNTVTYGTDAAPFLAIRTIHQCAEDNAPEKIADIIKKAFYVDDLLYGADTIEEAIHQVSSIQNTLIKGKLPLTKWMSNCDDILKHIPVKDQITSFMELGVTEIKLLGVSYDFKSDEIILRYKEPKEFKNTKRGVSSAAASFYDPLGFILPFIMMLRIFLQNIWKMKVEWDEPLDHETGRRFQNSLRNIQALNDIKIPRYLPADIDNCIELIGFSDASNHGQAAVIYSRFKVESGYKVSLVSSKGNVAKLKTKAVVASAQCTIPKLELEALLTLAKLYEGISKCFQHRIQKFTAYTDSQVVLAWLRSDKPNEKKFVERRVSAIKEIIKPENIHYVKSEDNPADPASRGLTAEQLAYSKLWFEGPEWLQQDELPTTSYDKKTVSQVMVTQNAEEDDLFLRISKWVLLLRVVALCLRWRHKSQKTYIDSSEIIRAKKRVIQYYQKLQLAEAVERLKNGLTVQKRHWLYSLSPFLDTDGTLRVGGRLGNAENLSNNQRHPIVFPKSHGLNLLITHTHQHNGHAGNALMTRLLIEEFWVPAIKQLIKSVTGKCVTCIRWQAKVLQPEMSQLPAERVELSTTFDKIGVDLCGPFTIKASPLKFDRTMKVWVVCFVCLSTKAVHLDLVSSLSTEYFLAAFGRFCSRRGTSREVWSDNGTNFIGASRILKDTWKKIIEECEKRTSIQEVSWKFIPRHSPTFGGLWEACVKSLKYFVKRMSAVKNLTYEEFYTLLTQVESLLNSRPLFPNPLNPEDDPALTPFHFINQRGYKPSSLIAVTNSPLTKKWFTIHQIRQQYWERFSTEYLRELQKKTKWQRPQPNLTINDIILIKEPNLSPGEWKMGRVIKTYPDPTGVVRKVSVTTAGKQSTLHASNRLVPLLKNEDEDQKSLRKSPRNKKNAITLLQICLLTLCIFSPSRVTASFSESLNEGLHMKSLRQVYHKIEEIQFNVKTNLNTTHDISHIRSIIDDFHDECQLRKQKTHIYKHCLVLNGSLNTFGLSIIDELKNYRNQPNSRPKRWVALAVKAAPYVVTGAGMLYQSYQIYDQNNQIKELQHEVKDVSNNLQQKIQKVLKIGSIKYEALDSKMNEVVEHQNDQEDEENLTKYAKTIETVFERIKLIYEGITYIKPLAELQKFVKPILERKPTLTLPDIGEEIFNIARPYKSFEDNIAMVSFTIPLVNKSKLNRWLILSIPDSQGHYKILSNADYVQHIVMDTRNTSYDNIDETSFIHPEIVQNISLTQLDSCSWSIFKDINVKRQCSQGTIVVKEDIIRPITTDLSLLIQKGSDITLTCGNQSTVITTPASLINSTLCNTVENFGTWNYTYNDEPDLKDFVTDNIKLLTEDPAVDTLVHQITEEINWQNFQKNLSNNWLIPAVIAASLIIILSLIVINIIIRCFKPTPPTRRIWLPDWSSPMTDTTV